MIRTRRDAEQEESVMTAPLTQSATLPVGNRLEPAPHAEQPNGTPGGAPDHARHDTRAILESVHDLALLLADPPPAKNAGGRPMIARSKAMRDILEQIECVAASRATVLLEGETGTGKEVVARLIHSSSPRARKPFVSVNCAALSESLVESELFGHEKGAFTGAAESRVGRFELAHGGTLLLDEISEMAPKLQAKLLRVLEEEEFERVGGTRSLRVDVRVIATSNRDLEYEVARGAFRRDLFYRLNVVRFRLAPLRARREDIPALVGHFLGQFRHETGTSVRRVSQQAMEILTAYEWPGNVRQLRNTLCRASILATGEEIEPCHLPPLDPVAGTAAEFRGMTLDEIERHVILSTLRELNGNKTAAAERLGVTARTLLNKMNKYHAQNLLDAP